MQKIILLVVFVFTFGIVQAQTESFEIGYQTSFGFYNDFDSYGTSRFLGPGMNIANGFTVFYNINPLLAIGSGIKFQNDIFYEDYDIAVNEYTQLDLTQNKGYLHLPLIIRESFGNRLKLYLNEGLILNYNIIDKIVTNRLYNTGESIRVVDYSSDLYNRFQVCATFAVGASYSLNESFNISAELNPNVTINPILIANFGNSFDVRRLHMLFSVGISYKLRKPH